MKGGDWRDPTSWINHNFYARFPMFANPALASPGGFTFGVSSTWKITSVIFIILFQKLNTNDDVKKEHIFVAGYSDGQVYLHSPSSDLASSWRYDTSPIYLRFDIHCRSNLLSLLTFKLRLWNHCVAIRRRVRWNYTPRSHHPISRIGRVQLWRQNWLDNTEQWTKRCAYTRTKWLNKIKIVIKMKLKVLKVISFRNKELKLD